MLFRCYVYFPPQLLINLTYMYRYPINDNSCFSTLLAINPLEHSMGSSLKRYLEIKVHPLFYGRNFDQIIVRNNFDRKSGISNKEKSNKLFNYIRPTAAIEDSTLYINCFPGIDYVFHYGNILKSYASLTNRFSFFIFKLLTALAAADFKTFIIGSVAPFGVNFKIA